MTEEQMAQVRRQITAIDERTKRIEEHVETIDRQLNEPIATEDGKTFYQMCLELISDGKNVRRGFRVGRYLAYGAVGIAVAWAQTRDGFAAMFSDLSEWLRSGD